MTPPALYEKQTSAAGRTRYVPHVPPAAHLLEIDENVLQTLVATFVVGFLEAAAAQLPGHSRHGRELRKVQDAVLSYARTTAVAIDDHGIDASVAAWNAAMAAMQQRLQ